MGSGSLGQEDPLEKGMATHSSILAWRKPRDRGAWHGPGVAESDTTERLSTRTQGASSVRPAPRPAVAPSPPQR